MTVGQPPFLGKNEEELFSAIVKKKILYGCPLHALYMCVRASCVFVRAVWEWKWNRCWGHSADCFSPGWLRRVPTGTLHGHRQRSLR